MVAIAVGSALVVLVDYPVFLLARAAAMLPIALALAVRASATKADTRCLADANLAVTVAE